MKRLLHRLKAADREWFFEKASLTEDTAEFSNPGRGWYQIYTFMADQEPDFDNLEWCIDKKDTLAMVILNIGYYRDRSLDPKGLGRIRSVLDFFAKHGYDMIVRAVYDHEGRAMEKEPWFFGQVLQHLEQLGELLKEFSEHIFVFQGMLVGSWGEMHSSRFVSRDKMIQMADILRRFRGEDTYLAVRRPVYWREIHGDMNAIDGMGLFDDGIFGSESDLGTFGTESESCASWNSPWIRADELAFENVLCSRVPNGGEAVFDNEFQNSLNPERVVGDLRKMQITYLNKVYDARQLDMWRQWKYTNPGPWNGKSLYDYIGAHLGYRFLIRNVTAAKEANAAAKAAAAEKGKQKQYLLQVEIENVGFAGFYHRAELYLECAECDGTEHRIVLEGQMKGWRSGEKRTLSCALAVRDCEMFLEIRRIKDGSCVRFANISDKVGRVMIGTLREGKPWRKHIG